MALAQRRGLRQAGSFGCPLFFPHRVPHWRYYRMEKFANFIGAFARVVRYTVTGGIGIVGAASFQPRFTSSRKSCNSHAS
jgi:hypothetical protein